MFLNNIIADPDRTARLIEIAKSSLQPLLEGAILYTIPLTIITFICGLLLAVLTALARLSSVKFLQIIARIYVSVIRGTPLLVQLFIIFYGLPTLGIIIDPFPSAVIGFSLNVGAYASEIIRAAIVSIPKGQWEAAYSLGMSYPKALKRVSLVKDTSLAAMILVTEMFRRAQEIAATNYEFLLLYSEVALIYWIICFLLSIIQSKLESKMDRYVAK